MKLSIENKKPIGNGILTSLNLEQAIQRSGIDEDVLDENKNRRQRKRGSTSCN